MSGKHTRGLLSHQDKRPQCGGFSLFAGDQFIGFVSDSDACTDWQANAERLVACWNACEGIDTADLNAGSGWRKGVLNMNSTTTDGTPPRWYCVNNMGMATHRAAQLVEAPKIPYPMAEPVAWMWRVADSDWQLESTCPPARPLAIVEPLYTGYMMADAHMAHRKAVQEAVREALHEAKKACENLPAPESCSGIEKSLWDVATMACAEAVGKMGVT